MELKKLGNTDLKTPPIMFGGNVFGWTLDKKESFKMLDMLLERGLTFIDTADMYGNEIGLSEKIIGKWMKERGTRDKITLATKAGRVHTIDEKGQKEKSINNSKSYLLEALSKSLERLQTDHVDLFYTHFDDEITPLNQVLEAHQQLIEENKVHYIGASNYSKPRLKEALSIARESDFPKYEVLQTEYNLMERKEFETELKQVCDDYEVSVASYFSLASGCLTGKYRKKEDFKGTARQGLTEKYFSDQGLNVLKALDEISEEHKVSNAGVALAWNIQRPGITAAIASATKEHHLDAFEEALTIKLSKEEMEKLNSASDF